VYRDFISQVNLAIPVGKISGGRSLFSRRRFSGRRFGGRRFSGRRFTHNRHVFAVTNSLDRRDKSITAPRQSLHESRVVRGVVKNLTQPLHG